MNWLDLFRQADKAVSSFEYKVLCLCEEHENIFDDFFETLCEYSNIINFMSNYNLEIDKDGAIHLQFRHYGYLKLI